MARSGNRLIWSTSTISQEPDHLADHIGHQEPKTACWSPDQPGQDTRSPGQITWPPGAQKMATRSQDPKDCHLAPGALAMPADLAPGYMIITRAIMPKKWPDQPAILRILVARAPAARAPRAHRPDQPAILRILVARAPG